MPPNGMGGELISAERANRISQPVFDDPLCLVGIASQDSEKEALKNQYNIRSQIRRPDLYEA